MPHLSRRQFLGTSVAGLAALDAKLYSAAPGANDTVRLAVAGLNGRGGDHLKAFVPMKGVRVTHLIDPDSATFPKRLKQVADLKGPEPKTVADVRTALESKDVDAITIATPNHWHALMTVWACQAGKDVYVEKPCSHELNEGRAAVAAARKYGRVVQHGTQRRGWKNYLALADVVKSGKYGPLRVSRGLVYKLRTSIGTKPAGPVPKTLDFGLWLGPAAERPFHGNLVHYNWHWFWDFGNGDVANQGVHQMDLARWMIPGAVWPKSVLSVGGRFGYEDQGETPNTQVTQFDYGDTQLVFEVRGLPTVDYHGTVKENDGLVLHFDGGVIAGKKFYPKGGGTPEDLPKGEQADNNIFANFIATVRSRKTESLLADIEVGHVSSGLCHLANVSYRLGTVSAFGPSFRPFGDNDAMAETMARTEEHLTANGVELTKTPVRVGRPLTWDAASERFVGDTEADRLLTRTYRAPFTLETPPSAPG